MRQDGMVNAMGPMIKTVRPGLDIWITGGCGSRSVGGDQQRNREGWRRILWFSFVFSSCIPSWLALAHGCADLHGRDISLWAGQFVFFLEFYCGYLLMAGARIVVMELIHSAAFFCTVSSLGWMICPLRSFRLYIAKRLLALLFVVVVIYVCFLRGHLSE
ncbi:hypothetical protein BJ508DRAFT_78839 [Ascobolus immersus RN42]|uniref:Uncharacterized protein n=1 Tax=Ascobolus immersus RN42 TaxID=1160509 RepID=A0A3N4IG06_ASCIM|nr:hypothetical protein BJ508DRAFT_78839 [Ascobolus immersus RN42]